MPPRKLTPSRVVDFFRPRPGDPLSQTTLGDALAFRSARGAVATLTTQWARLFLQTATTVILARLLTPQDYGLTTMVIALIGFGEVLWNLGLSTATIQNRHVTGAQVNFFFWLQSALGLLLMAIFVATAPLIAHFYGDQRLAEITVVLSATLLIGGLSAQPIAVLSRQMRFALISVIEIISLGLSLAVALAVALAGGGYWAIVASMLTAYVIRLVMAWASCSWRPGRPARADGVGSMIRFGINLSVTNTIDYVSQNIDNVLIGKFYGAETLGIYSRAYNLLLLPVRQIHYPMSRVAVPVLSYLQDQPERYRRYFRTALSALAYLGLPTLALLAAYANEVVRVLLGPQWSAVVPIFQVLAIAGAVTTIRATNGWIFVSTGHTGRGAVWSLIQRSLMIVGIVVGLPWGAIGVAWGFTLANLVTLLPSFVVAVKDSPLRVSDVWASSRRPLVFSAAVFLLGVAIHRTVGPYGVLLTLLVGAVATLALTGLLLLVWPNLRFDVLALARALLHRRNKPAEVQVGTIGHE